MSITHITSLSQLNGILDKSTGKLSVIDFHATWCPPCHAIAPVYEALAKQYPLVNFMKCDVDAARDVSKFYNVSAMPTFVFLRGHEKVDLIRGANKSALEAALRKHSSNSDATTGVFTGKGETLSGYPGDSPGLDPQLKVALTFIFAYLLFWYFSS